MILKSPDSLLPKTATSDSTLRRLLLQFWGQITHRRQLALAFSLMLISGLAEMVSLAAVFPFLAILTNPDLVWSKPLVQQWATRLGITNPHDLLPLFVFGFVLIVVLASTIQLLSLWINCRTAAKIGSDFSCRLYSSMLFQPYEEQIKINSSQRIALMNRELNVVISALDQLLQMLSASIIVVALVVTLLAINWLVALIVGVAIVLVYVVVMVGTKRPLQKLGLRKVEFTRQFIQALQEGLGGIRDVIIDGSQSFYIDLLKKSDKPLRQMSVKASFLIRFPRFVMEPIGIIVIALAAYLLVSQEGVTNSIPQLGAFALGAQRLLPKAQKIYESWAFINNAKGSFKKIIQQLECYQSFSMLQQPKSLGFKQSIQFSAVSHRYEDGREEVLKQINLEIRKGERIGLIGATGSGKSTLVDLMMGLLKPTSGQITIDGGDLHDYQDSSRLQAWRASIAHVPQTIYLADSSIAENIAFGSPRDQIDMCRVRQSAKQAHIAEFIECQPDSYDGLVGERGVRLSGGQRQRIGIARAIYKQTQILVFDEATSALDNATEESIMSTIESLSDDITMVMIAHRLTSVMFCDRLVRLVDGRIDAIGSPNDLLA